MRIEHVAIYVNDLEKAREFFVRYMGGKSGGEYRNERTGFRSYFVGFDGGARLELMSRPGMADFPKPPNRTGYAHVAFCLGSRAAVDELTERIRRDGHEVLGGPRVTGDGYYESSVVAVEGCVVELCE